MKLGITIKQHRLRAGVSQITLARKLGITPPYLSAVENGRREPSLPLLRQVCRILRTAPEVFFWEAVEPTGRMKPEEKKILAQAKVLLKFYYKSL